jgi:hypothetical protein
LFGDGSTVKNPKKMDPRVGMASERLLTHLNDITGTNIDNDKIVAVNEGYRPYLPKGESRFVRKHDEKLYSATGGAKSTTILCGHMAKQVMKKINKVIPLK